jgi:peptidoglycan/LPS O-acetylase OafA/YrhL
MAHDGGKLSNIQVLRAVAATLVIFVHLKILLSAIGLPAFGASGVDLFFVISGYIMVYTTFGRRVSAADFIRNRIARIVPIYWLMTLLVFLIALVAPTLLQSTTANVIFLIKSFLFIPFYRAPGDFSPILFVGWTLNYEMFFYALFALGLLFPSSLQGLLFTLVVLAGLSLAGSLGLSEDSVFQVYTQPIILEFALGMLIAIVFRKSWVFSAPVWRYVLIALALLGLAVLIAPPFLPGTGRFNGFLSHGLAAALTVWAALALEKRGDYVRMGLLVSLGDASYSMYLTHPFVVQTFQRLFASAGGNSLVSTLFIGLCLVAVMALALVVHRMIEVPLTRLARHVMGIGARPRAFHVA